jgi:hypothetical protein
MPAICALTVRPFAETGINDDWSYIRTAELLAKSGKIVYNGWATAMLGWQLYLGALFVKLFGFSFTAVRASTLIVAMATAFLLQRTLVRAGIRDWNATLATLTLVLSPLFLPLVFSFMSDVSGVFCVVLCLYMCLRALQAETVRSAIAWIGIASLLNAVGGTARQIAWLGVLVMIPSTLWLLRRKQRVLLIGGVSNVLGIAVVYASMRWFNHQPYSIGESFSIPVINLKAVENSAISALRGGAEFILLLLPVLLAFVALLRNANRRMVAVFAAGSLPFALFGFIEFRHHALRFWLAPFCGNYVTARGLVDIDAILGRRPVVLPETLCLILTIATIIGFASLLAAVFGGAPRSLPLSGTLTSISWRDLGVILVPFTLSYIALVVPRILSGLFYDRYLLPLMIPALLVIVRYHQEKVMPKLPNSSVALIVIFGLYGAAATHDLFAMYRGYLAASEEIRASGIPDSAISGNREKNAWVELEKNGHINDPRIRNPIDAYVAQPVGLLPAGCADRLVPIVAIKPLYALSFDPTSCAGPTEFPPVAYRTWLAPHVTLIYIVKYPASSRR